MLESLIESCRDRRSFWRPATFGVALSLHLGVLGAIAVESHFNAPPTSEPPLRVTFLRFAPSSSGPHPGPGAAAASAPAPMPGATKSDPAPPQAEAETPAPVSAELMQPQVTPAKISTVAHAEPRRAPAGTEVEGGTPRGTPGGAPGGTPGGVPGGPLGPGGDVVPPVVLHRVQPVYPVVARTARVEGAVTLEAVILRDGTVGDIQVVQGLRMGCTEAAIEALKRWRFRPGECQGAPADVYFTLTVDFILGN